ncbi:endonuclease V [Actinocorallia populi]|uniref:endonuclease V n=1 Tax=Actinocorallia populi TaxID=2079200 RepID=UPI000D08DAB1|nr:endonuclease V [Actinocorallia populi]
MDIKDLHPWPSSEQEAQALQERLRGLVRQEPGPAAVRTVAGLDVAYADDRVAAAVVVLDAATLRPVETAVAVERPSFPYVPGLFAFRELPALLSALRRLDTVPDLLVCDGHGRAHFRRFGLACHLGLLTGLPAMGVGKTFLVGEHVEPGRERGAFTDLVHEGEVVGRTVRTQTGVKPVYVSVGHRTDLEAATRHVLALSPSYRLPETTRQADRLSREALRAPGSGPASAPPPAAAPPGR